MTTPPGPPGHGPRLERWLSPDRFRTYLQLAGYNRARALDLHEWSTQLNAALMHEFAHLEVGLRKFYDRALMAAVQTGDSHWTDQGLLHGAVPGWEAVTPVHTGN